MRHHDFESFSFHYDKPPGYELGFKHGREYERKYPEWRGPNPVYYKIREKMEEFERQSGTRPTRVYLGTAEVHTIAGDGKGLAYVMGLEVFAVKAQYHCEVA